MIRYQLLLLAVLITLFPAVPVAQDVERPDVLFIAVDDLNDWVGVLGGHLQTRTPNIDELAERGMIFTNAHAPSTLCNPSRTALLSGMRPSTSGVYGNAPDWRDVPEIFESIETLPRYFRENGYRTLGAGKIFHAATFGRTDDIEGFNDPTAWDAFYPSLQRHLPDEIRPPRRPVNGNPLSVNFDWSAVIAEDSATGDGQVVSWIERQLLGETGSPRFVAAGIYRPHLPWYVPQRYLDMHPLDNVELPATIENDLDDIPELGRASNAQSREWQEWIATEGRWEEGVQAYLASISFADAMVGRLIDALDESGRANHTIIVLWSDHGYDLGSKGRWRKMTLWEESTHVPLIIIAPGVTTPGSKTGTPVSLMNIYPTLADLAGLEIPEHVEGSSLLPLLVDPGAKWDEPALTTFGHKNHAVRTERYLYIQYSDGSQELYDHESGPHEWTNLAGDRRYIALKAELAAWLPRENAEDLAPTALTDPTLRD